MNSFVHTPRKRFGQHFLKDKNIIHRIVSALSPQQSDHLVEIGPGQGAITLPVLKIASKLDAIEFDRDLIADLQRRSESLGELTIYPEDVLSFDFNQLKNDQRPLRVFGNLPYNISTPLVFHLLAYADLISDMVFMFQKEVAERMSAGFGTNHYGRLSVMVQYYCKIDYLFDVPKEAFLPPPKVQSSVIKLTPYLKPPYVAEDPLLFAEIVRLAFNQRRKTLRNSLKNRVTDERWETIPIRSDLRPEDLSVKDFVIISNAINQ